MPLSMFRIILLLATAYISSPFLSAKNYIQELTPRIKQPYNKGGTWKGKHDTSSWSNYGDIYNFPKVYTVGHELLSSQDVSTSTAGLRDIIERDSKRGQRYIFFGGKGGVGKTSTSAAAAVKCADSSLNTLIVSTDPAHSLTDSLDQNVSGGVPVPIEGVERLWGMEIDPSKAVQDFEDALNAFDVSTLASSLGVPMDLIENLGLQEFSQILRNPPPGIDELVALASVLKLVNSESEMKFDRIVIDTAPTGHTLRLLNFPDFLDQFLNKLIALRSRLDGIFNMISSLFNNKENIVTKADEAVNTLKSYREEIVALRELFLDSDSTEFCIVSIPTHLAFAESSRLLESLRAQGISVRNIILNQMMDPNASEEYLKRQSRGQEACMKRLERLKESNDCLKITTVPFFDMEVTGVYPLRYMSNVAFGEQNAENWDELINSVDQKFVIVGGKGGVGKTSSSAALAIKFSDAGYRTVVVSTDPAHSLGDALEMNLSDTKKGTLVEVPGGLLTSGALYAMEVDTEGALKEFKDVVEKYLKRIKAQGGSSSTAGVLNQLNLEDFTSILDSAAPGTDELVALSKVLKLVRGGTSASEKFDRIVIDTAPTGHTLSMLSYPNFLDNFFEKLIRLRGRFKGAASMLNMFGGSDVSNERDEEQARDALRDFQFKMIDLQELFRDEDLCEFVIVTAPTILAVAESERLFSQLKEQAIPVKHILVNKVISQTVGDEYIRRLVRMQGEILSKVETLASHSIHVTKVPMFDVEVRGVYALRAMGAALFQS